MMTSFAEYWPLFVIVILVIAVVAAVWLRRGARVSLSDATPTQTLARAKPVVPELGPDGLPVGFFQIAPMAGTPDNLLEIKGLGPKIAMLLNGIGVTRFEQIARLTPEEQIALDKHLGPFKGRIDQDRWIDQARILASGDRAAFAAEFGNIDGGKS